MIDNVYGTSFQGEDRVLFEIAPTPIWLEDWSAVERFCNELKRSGTTDLRSLLEADESLLRSTVSLVDVIDVNQRAADFVGANDRAALIGPLPGELLNAGTLGSLIDQIMTVCEGRSFLQADISGVDLGGADIECELDWAAPTRNGGPDYSQVVILVRDVSHHRAIEKTMERHVRQLEALLDMGRGMASTFDIDAILELLAAVGTELLDADQALIALVDTKSKQITRRVTLGGLGDPLPAPTYDEIMERLPGWAIHNRTATLTDDLTTDSRSVAMPPDLAAALANRPATVAPIAKDDLVLGVLVILREAGATEFTEMDLSLVRMLAMQAAVAIRNAELYEELRANRDYVHTAHEELKDTQVQLLAAQKMEAIGSLASGIAHEINTPIQFVSDNSVFVKESLGTITDVVARQRKFLESVAANNGLADEVAELQALWDDNDCDFLLEELPQAIDESLEGAKRVAEIVRAMKEFAHPGSQAKSPVDINRVIETTLQVSRNEWKYVAEVELDLDADVPTIDGHGGPLGQSLLIMFVNSAQAMAEHRNVAADGKGTIRVSTRLSGGAVEIRVADNGPGIPQEIVDRIFDPFFTTKEVGKGSGQGLSIARSVVVDKHGGELRVENGDPGAVFVIRLPVDAPLDSTPASEDE